MTVWYSRKKLSGTSYLYQMVIVQAGEGDSFSLLSSIVVILVEGFTIPRYIGCDIGKYTLAASR